MRRASDRGFVLVFLYTNTGSVHERIDRILVEQLQDNLDLCVAQRTLSPSTVNQVAAL